MLKPKLPIPQLKKGRVKNAEAHTASTKYGMGDYYGTGLRNAMGKVRDITPGINPVPPNKLKKPPKNLA